MIVNGCICPRSCWTGDVNSTLPSHTHTEIHQAHPCRWITKSSQDTQKKIDIALINSKTVLMKIINMGLACGIFVLCFTSPSSSVVPPPLSFPLYLGLVFRSTFLPSLHLSFMSSSGWWGLSLSPPEQYFPCEDRLRLYLSWPSPFTSTFSVLLILWLSSQL